VAMNEPASVMAFALDLFEKVGQVSARRMFGGVGLFSDGVMFGLIDEGIIFLKTDEKLRGDLSEAGSHAWVYVDRKGPRAGVPQETHYWSLPQVASDDPEEASEWGRRALAVALAKRDVGQRRKPRR